MNKRQRKKRYLTPANTVIPSSVSSKQASFPIPVEQPVIKTQASCGTFLKLTNFNHYNMKLKSKYCFLKRKTYETLIDKEVLMRERVLIKQQRE